MFGRVVVRLIPLWASLSACQGTAVEVEIRGGFEIPTDVDSLCVSIAAVETQGDEETFHRVYRGSELGPLPQTIVITPGEHDEAQVWVRARRAGLEIARAGARVGFRDGDVAQVTLDLSDCPAGETPTPAVVAEDTDAGVVQVAIALGWRAPVVVAIGAATAVRYRAEAGALSSLEGGVPTGPTELPWAVVPADVDDDCDDDLVVAAPGAAPQVWIQGSDATFSLGEELPVAEVRALAGADVNDDGHLDLALGALESTILFGDGQGSFLSQPDALQGAPPVDVTALAFGDLSGDGTPDLVVGQGSDTAAPLLVFLNEGGVLVRADGVISTLPLRTRGVAVTDANDDDLGDVVAAALGSRVRAFVNRGGLLEDRSYLAIPSSDVIDATALSVADLDGDCLRDLAVGLLSGAPLLWRATATGQFVPIDTDPTILGTYPVLADADGDGGTDLVLGGTGGLVWAAP